MSKPLEPIYKALEQIKRARDNYKRWSDDLYNQQHIEKSNNFYIASSAYAHCANILEDALAKAESMEG